MLDGLYPYEALMLCAGGIFFMILLWAFVFQIRSDSGRYYSRDEKYTSALALLRLAQRDTQVQALRRRDVNRSCIDSNLVRGAKYHGTNSPRS